MKGNAISRMLQALVALGIVLLAVGLLTESEALGEGIKNGLAVSGGVLIPSLFPFMVLSGFISQTKWGRILSAPLGPLTEKIFKLPRELGIVVLLSLVGGFPVGAKTIAGLLDQKRINTRTAERMLCFCVNAGPPFLVTAVGAGMFLDKRAGVILLATQTVSTLLIGVAVSARVAPERGSRNTAYTGGAPAFVQAVTGASSAMIAMCSFAVLFSGLLSLVTHLGLSARLASALPVGVDVVDAVLGGLLEVTTGCIAAAKIGGEGAFLLTSACVSFSGLSVIFQILSCFKDHTIRFRPFLLSRLAHIPLAASMALPLYRKFCVSTATMAQAGRPVLVVDIRTVVISVCLLGMSTILLLSVRAGTGRRIRRKH